jgi:hypothetical protein
MLFIPAKSRNRFSVFSVTSLAGPYIEIKTVLTTLALQDELKPAITFSIGEKRISMLNCCCRDCRCH